MRRTLVEELIKQDNKDTYFLTADVGYGVLEPLMEKMGDRFINVGIAEQSMISIAAGLTLNGKKVYTYTMCAFYLRCIEQIKLDLCYQDLQVTMLGVGTGFDYEQHGTTHFALEDEVIMKQLLNIDVITPKYKTDLIQILKAEVTKPRYIRISRFDENKEFIFSMDKYPKEGGHLEYYKSKYSTKLDKIFNKHYENKKPKASKS